MQNEKHMSLWSYAELGLQESLEMEKLGSIFEAYLRKHAKEHIALSPSSSSYPIPQQDLTLSLPLQLMLIFLLYEHQQSFIVYTKQFST